MWSFALTPLILPNSGLNTVLCRCKTSCRLSWACTGQVHWQSLSLFPYRGTGNLVLASTCPLDMALLPTCMAHCITKVALRGVMTPSTPVTWFCAFVLSGSHRWLGQPMDSALLCALAWWRSLASRSASSMAWPIFSAFSRVRSPSTRRHC